MKNGTALIITASVLVMSALAFDFPQQHIVSPADGGASESKQAGARTREVIDAEAFLPALIPFSFEARDVPCETIRAMLVPHHDTAAEMIASAFRDVEACRKNVRTVIILSPDHYFAAPGEIIIGDVRYGTKTGIVETDSDLLRDFQHRVGGNQDSSAFRNEHGVGILIPFVKHAFPDARIMPLIINQRISERQHDAIASWLETVLAERSDAFVIVSADMSHYLSDVEAEARDREAKDALEQKDAAFFLHATDDYTDNGKSIALVMHALEYGEWVLAESRRSPEYGGSKRYTTTYFTGFWSEPTVSASSNTQ